MQKYLSTKLLTKPMFVNSLDFHEYVHVVWTIKHDEFFLYFCNKKKK